LSAPTLKFDAEALRLGLVAGTVDVREVVAWADRAILANQADDAPVLLDLSLAGRRSVSEVVSLLGEVPGEADPPAVGRQLAGELATRLAAGQMDIVATARAMYRILREGYAPDREFEGHAYAADDGVDLALSGTYGTLDDVRHDVAEFLSRYATTPPAV
jgi:hypothetical protein